MHIVHLHTSFAAGIDRFGEDLFTPPSSEDPEGGVNKKKLMAHSSSAVEFGNFVNFYQKADLASGS